jgi:hypothetical protein
VRWFNQDRGQPLRVRKGYSGFLVRAAALARPPAIVAWRLRYETRRLCYGVPTGTSFSAIHRFNKHTGPGPSAVAMPKYARLEVVGSRRSGELRLAKKALAACQALRLRKASSLDATDGIALRQKRILQTAMKADIPGRAKDRRVPSERLQLNVKPFWINGARCRWASGLLAMPSATCERALRLASCGSPARFARRIGLPGCVTSHIVQNCSSERCLTQLVTR